MSASPTEIALFDTFRQQVRDGHLTRAGLLSLRNRLGDDSTEFEPSTSRELLAIEVSDELARRLRVDPSDMPGAPVVPDTIEGIDGGETRRSRW